MPKPSAKAKAVRRPYRTLLLKRGKGYAFRIAVPTSVRGKFKSRTGKPLTAIVETLKTRDEVKAENEAAKRRAHWLTVFERAEQDAPLTLAEIDAEARELYISELEDRDAYARQSRLPVQEDRDTLRFELTDLVFASFIERAELGKENPDWQPRLEAHNDFTFIAHEIAKVERRKGIKIDPESETYRNLGRALVRAKIAALQGRIKAIGGKPSEAPQTFLGASGIDPVSLRPVKLSRAVVRLPNERGPKALFEQWIAETKPAVSTVNRWRAVFLNLQDKFGKRDISEDEARDWAKGLVSAERSPGTVSDVWLSSARTIYKWAVEQKLANGNPFASVKIAVPEQNILRDKSFTDDEAETILRAASKIEPNDNAFKAAQRWVPWLCAYSGARAGEITQLRGQDVETRGGVTTMRITPEAGTVKTREFRLVPLHEHLLAQDFLSFVKSRGKGPLFYNPAPDGNSKEVDAGNPQRPRAVKTRERLAEWVRELGVTDKGIRPNHAWRHTFKQIAERSGISERISDTITGHAPTTAGRGYGRPTVEDMAEALKRFPRYKV